MQVPIPGPAITPNAFAFQTMLMQPDPTNSELVLPIPTEGFNGTSLTSLQFVDTAENLLGVAWLERYSETNLYNTKSQDLIAMSLAGMTTCFQIHSNPMEGDSGRIFVHRARKCHARPDLPDQDWPAVRQLRRHWRAGFGSVFIFAPTNGSLGAGSLNALKNVTVGSAQYLVGDAYPFRWFNAGDFGDTNLDINDVLQVFQSACYSLNYPPPGSDFADSMDSAGGLGIDSGNGYFIPFGPVASEATLFQGNDTSINFNMFW
jgi:hypothetical protein